MAHSSVITKIAVKLLAEDFVRVLYESLLDRPPDDAGLRSYTALLRQTGDLRLIARELSRSDEAWEKSLVSHREDLGALILRGLLGRDPNPLELETITGRLTGTHGLESALYEFPNTEGFRSARGLTEAGTIPAEIYQIATGDAATPRLDISPKSAHELRTAIKAALEQTFRSDHLYERIVKIHADKFVRTMAQGITGSEPDAKTLEAQTAGLQASGDLRLVAKDLSHSHEAWEKLLVSRPDDLAALIFRGLLGRDPDSSELSTLSPRLTDTHAIKAALEQTFRSDRLYERMVKIHADKFVRAMAQGIMGSEPDAKTLEAQTAGLQASGDLRLLAKDLSHSHEAWEKFLVSRPDDLAALILRGLLGRDPIPLELETITGRLTGTHELENALYELPNTEGFRSARGLTEAGTIPAEIYQIATGDTATPRLDISPKNAHELRTAIKAALEQTFRSDRLYERIVKIHADKFVRTMAQGITGSEPDAKTLEAQTAGLQASGDLRLVAKDLSHSHEAWEKSLVSRPDDLAALILRGLLGRDPDTSEIGTLSRQLTDTHELESALDQLLHSEGFRSARGLTEAGKIPAEIYQIATGDTATSRLDISPKNAHELRAAIKAALEQTFRSDRLYERMVKIHAEKLVRAITQGVTGREPDANSLDSQSRELRGSGDLAELIYGVTRSEIRRFEDQGLDNSRHRHLFGDRPAWVFLHTEKTGGTSLQNMLRAAVDPRVIYSEHADNLYLHPPNTLAAFDVFAGHFNYDSLRFIPRNVIKSSTILRDPYERLMSLYTFWRAHKPEAPTFSPPMEEAGRLDVHRFFREAKCLTTPSVWNHMTWCVMGDRKWKKYQQMLGIDDVKVRAARIQKIQREISVQIKQFEFIGIQEHFAETCVRLFKLMDLKQAVVRHDNSVKELTERDDKLFRYVARPQRTQELEMVLARLTELDDILYAQAKTRFESSRDEI